MSASKSPLPLDSYSTPNAPPPSYSESLSAPRGHASRVPKLVESHILPRLHGDPITTLVLIPSDVSTLIPETTTSTSPAAFSHESIVGFHSTENPTIVRLSGAENALDFWRRGAVIGELESQLRVRLSDVGYTVIRGSPKAKALASSRIAGSQNVDWKGVERKSLTEGEARVTAEIKEVCLRIENEMGLYETRKGRAVIVTVELGMTGDMDD